MTLSFAERCAVRLVEWLSPKSERLEVAGSVRRRRPQVGDIDLVCVPKIDRSTDLFGAQLAVRNLAADEVRRRCKEEGWTIRSDGEHYMVWDARGVQVDLWFATPERIGTLLLCRTGSKEHNIWLAERAIAFGGKWNPHHGLYLPGRARVADCEGAIYDALALPLIAPEDREISKLAAFSRGRAQSLATPSPPKNGAV